MDPSNVGSRDAVVNLVTHSDMRELSRAVIAAAALCSMADGVLWDTEAGEWISSTDVLRWAREVEAEIRRA